MNCNEMLSIGYIKYKDDSFESKNGYSLSYEHLNSIENEYLPTDQVNERKSLHKKMCKYFLWTSIISGISFICYLTIIEMYHV